MTATKPMRTTTDPNHAISIAVDLLRERKGVTVEQLAVYAGVNRSQLYRKLKGETGWKATDIARLADYFSVLPGDLFTGPDVLGCAIRDSNPEPAD
jgi:transcriptional regulator with XRE-family HTH domain